MECQADSPWRAAACSLPKVSESKDILASSALRWLMKASVAVCSFARRLPSCLLLVITCSAEAMRSLKLVMAMFFFFCSESIVARRVCASRSSSRRERPWPSPSSERGSSDIPAVNACIDHCAFSISFFVPASCWASASNLAFSFSWTFSFCSICFLSSPTAEEDCFNPSIWDLSSEFLFFSLDSVEAISFDSLECSSSSFLSSFPRALSRERVLSLISRCTAVSRSVSALMVDTS
mmetsp:Transcript_21807/g.34939  ORF Transcript_21807/g.34939 Transcript_21807/m.34939 type:complete len:236 (+) Transcript_21807:3432-4139(+)